MIKSDQKTKTKQICFYYCLILFTQKKDEKKEKEENKKMRVRKSKFNVSFKIA